MTLADRIRAALVDELAATIDADRDDVEPTELATALLQWEGGNRSLLGLARGCHRAVYFDETVSLVHSFPIPEGELVARAEVESWTAEGRPEAYASVRDRTGWDWVHPRYRWVLDLELQPAEAED